MTPDQHARAIAAAALVRAMLARDFWTAERILARWLPGQRPADSFAVDAAMAAVDLAVAACGGDRDRALAQADLLLDQLQRTHAAGTRAA